MKRIYTGSVKNVYLADDGEHLWFEYTDDYSVFDWGKMPDPIEGKGEILARLGEWFFGELTDAAAWERVGLGGDPAVKPWLPIAHHFVKREGNRLMVKRVDVPELPPGRVGGQLVYDYSFEPKPRQLIPLEVIFRFGVPAGSSLLSRKDWYPFEIHEGAEFDEPLIEFSTKLESKDRMVSYQEAALILKGRRGALAEVHGKTQAIARFLQMRFRERGLKLWDGKLEWALMDGEIALVDSIGPDELRVGAGDAVFDKQFLRNFYLGSDWDKALQQGKELARERGVAEWKEIVEGELKSAPGPLTPPYREAAEALYQDFYAILVQGEAATRFTESLKKL
jgi:phosphoribosylaminoimidazole-succinocarboxamide synthase